MSKIKQLLNVSKPLPVINPFIFTMHHLDYYPKGNGKLEPADLSGKNEIWQMYHGQEIPGFPVHPHRGFETVTVVEEGFVDHTDGLGSKGRYANGDVQWMTAGKGTQHAEMFPLVHEDKENKLNLFQIWLNLPKNKKMVNPDYKMHWSEEIPVIDKLNTNNPYWVKIIAGEFEGVKALHPTPNSWASDPSHHVGIFLMSLQPAASITIPKISTTLVRMLYIYQGDNISIDNHLINRRHFVILDGNEEIEIKNTSTETVKFLLMEGEPIDEPIVAYGPFVMNSQEEIKKAYDDYYQTQFGGWPHDRQDPVNDKHIGRFAGYADGTIIYPPQK